MRILRQTFWHAVEWPIALAWALFAWFTKATSRITVEGAEPAGAVVYVNWHRYQSFLIAFHGMRRHWMLVSPSPQLAPVARFCRLMGLRLVRGASGERGKEALEELRSVLQRGDSVAIAVDGPRGPVMKAKKGCVELARSAGVPIVPIAYRCRRAHEFLWRWDRMLMPLPFADIQMLLGTPITVTGDDAEILATVERELNALEAQSVMA